MVYTRRQTAAAAAAAAAKASSRPSRSVEHKDIGWSKKTKGARTTKTSNKKKAARTATAKAARAKPRYRIALDHFTAASLIGCLSRMATNHPDVFGKLWRICKEYCVYHNQGVTEDVSAIINGRMVNDFALDCNTTAEQVHAVLGQIEICKYVVDNYDVSGEPKEVKVEKIKPVVRAKKAKKTVAKKAKKTVAKKAKKTVAKKAKKTVAKKAAAKTAYKAAQFVACGGAVIAASAVTSTLVCFPEQTIAAGQQIGQTITAGASSAVDAIAANTKQAADAISSSSFAANASELAIKAHNTLSDVGAQLEEAAEVGIDHLSSTAAEIGAWVEENATGFYQYLSSFTTAGSTFDPASYEAVATRAVECDWTHVINDLCYQTCKMDDLTGVVSTHLDCSINPVWDLGLF